MGIKKYIIDKNLLKIGDFYVGIDRNVINPDGDFILIKKSNNYLKLLDGEVEYGVDFTTKDIMSSTHVIDLDDFECRTLYYPAQSGNTGLRNLNEGIRLGYLKGKGSYGYSEENILKAIKLAKLNSELSDEKILELIEVGIKEIHLEMQTIMLASNPPQYVEKILRVADIIKI